MKVYFEVDGRGYGKLYLNAYVNPTRDGHGYRFDLLGKKHQFAWTHTKEARVFEHTELPEEMWFSISHGSDHFMLDAEKADNWTFSDLVYDKIEKESVDAYMEFNKVEKKIKTVDDFKKIYPTIKKCGFVSCDIIGCLFRVLNVPRTPAYNGEIGIAFMMDEEKYRIALIMLGLEQAPQTQKQ